jgi:hypothetical protein
VQYHPRERPLASDFAAATILNPIADTGSVSIENSSAWAELFARDNREPCRKNALQLGGQNEAHCYARRADLDRSRTTPQGSTDPVIVAGEIVRASGLPPYDPETGAKS